MMNCHGFKKDKLRYMLPPAITLVIYSVILAVKGIYPFGNNTIDYYDMAQQIAAFYYHVYDALHGTKGFFYDWYTALGVNMAMSTSGCSNISLFNLFFLFIRRSSLLESLSVFNGIKLMCLSFTMYFYLDKTHKEAPGFFRVVASVGYSFCGFVLVLYITNQWVDIAVMFPLIMYFYDRLLKTGKMTGYVITLTITLIASYYLGFMILIFIFLYTGLILAGDRLFLAGISGCNSEKSGKSAASLVPLGIGTALSLALSSFILVPQLTQMLSSARFKNGNGSESTGLIGKYLEILSHVKGEYTTRWWSLLGISFMAAVIVTGLFASIRSCLIHGRKKAGEDNCKDTSAEDAAEDAKSGETADSATPDEAEDSAMTGEAAGGETVSDEKADCIGITMTDILRRRPVLTTIVLILMMVLELFFESINLIWHFGSYIQYPIRNGFIIYFIFAYLSCYFAGRLYGKYGADDESGVTEDEAEKAPASEKAYLGFIFTVAAFLVFIAFYRNHPGMPLRRVFHITSGIMAVSFVFYLILLNYEALKKSLHLNKDKRAEEETRVTKERIGSRRYRWAAGILAFEVLCYGFLLFGKPDFITGYAEEPEQNGEYIRICEQLREAFDLQNEFLLRVKNPDESLNANYGFVLMQPELSNWTHMIAPGEQDGAAAWGYSIQFTRLLDSGGTVFSDALLGVRNVISCVPMDERLYEPVDKVVVTVDHLTGETAEYTLYKPKYTLPFGVVCDGSEDTRKELEEVLDSADTVGLHNVIYRAVRKAADKEAGEGDKDVAYWLLKDGSVMDENTKVDESVSKTVREITIETRIGEESALYLLGSGGDKEYANCTIEILGKGSESGSFIRIPTIGDRDNIYYPAHFNNNAVYLGCYSNEPLKLRITMDINKGEEFDPEIMGISMDALDKLCGAYTSDADNDILAGNRTLSFTADIGNPEDEDDIMLLPLTYDRGWKVQRNGHRVRAYSAGGLFTAIPLVTGENNVTMKFTPPGMLAGTIITLVSLILSVAYIIICRVKKTDILAPLNDRVSPVLAIIYVCVTVVVVLVMYLMPIIYGIYVLAAKR